MSMYTVMSWLVLYTLQRRKSHGETAKAGTVDKKKATETKAVAAKGGTGQGTASDNASDALFAGLADNKM